MSQNTSPNNIIGILEEFFTQVCKYSNFKKKYWFSVQGPIFTFRAHKIIKKVGYLADYDILIITISLLFPDVYPLLRGEQKMFLTEFEIKPHPDCSVEPKLLTVEKFLIQKGFRLPTEEQRNKKELMANYQDEFFVISSLEQLLGLLLDYERWARFYGCKSVFKLAPPKK